MLAAHDFVMIHGSDWAQLEHMVERRADEEFTEASRRMPPWTPSIGFGAARTMLSCAWFTATMTLSRHTSLVTSYWCQSLIHLELSFIRTASKTTGRTIFWSTRHCLPEAGNSGEHIRGGRLQARGSRGNR